MILIYTPQTYINYIYTLHILLSNTSERKIGMVKILEKRENFKDRFCRDQGNEIVIYLLVVPSTEGEIVKMLVRGIRKKIKECISDNRYTQVIGFLHGISMVSVPLYIELNRLKK